jgi:hypothetical protein
MRRWGAGCVGKSSGCAFNAMNFASFSSSCRCFIHFILFSGNYSEFIILQSHAPFKTCYIMMGIPQNYRF